MASNRTYVMPNQDFLFRVDTDVGEDSDNDENIETKQETVASELEETEDNKVVPFLKLNFKTVQWLSIQNLKAVLQINTLYGLKLW